MKPGRSCRPTPGTDRIHSNRRQYCFPGRGALRCGPVYSPPLHHEEVSVNLKNLIGKVPVLLSVCGCSKEPDEEVMSEEISTMASGTLERDAAGIYTLIYQDASPDSDTVGTVTLRIEPDRVTMERTGEEAVYMVFEKRKRYDSLYQTEYGDMYLGLYTMEIDRDIREDQGYLRLLYQVETTADAPWVQELTVRFAVNE